jgi:class 3 adenylate cyclase
VTILYCGLVGLNALSEQLDAEDLCSVLRADHKLCAAAITRAGGHVASCMGDGVVVAYFG